MEVNMSLVGTRVDLAGKMKELLDAKVNKNATAISAAFIKDGELIAALAYGTQDGNQITLRQYTIYIM